MRIGGFNVLKGDWVVWYPEDLPADWRVDYYANEYPAVLFSAEEWRVDGGLSEDDVSELEWPDHLNVFVEWDDSSLESAIFVTFCNRVMEMELDITAWVYSGTKESRLPSSLYRASRELKAKKREWNGWRASDMEGSVMKLTPKNAGDLREMRAEFERWKDQESDEVIVLINDSPENLNRFQALSELMGV